MGGLFIEKIKRAMRDQKHHCCPRKYSVLSHPATSTRRSNTKQDQVRPRRSFLIQQALALARKIVARGLQCLPAYLGLFQKQTPGERLTLLSCYLKSTSMFLGPRDPSPRGIQLQSYPNRHHLQDSTLIRRSIDETVAPRFISKPPRPQPLGQHRECCAPSSNGWGKKHANGQQSGLLITCPIALCPITA